MFGRTRDNRLTRAKRIVNKRKYQEETGMLLFSSLLLFDKNFVQVQKMKCKHIGWCIKLTKKFVHTNFPVPMMNMGVLSSEDNLMPPHFFFHCARVNATAYTEVLKL